MARSTLLLAFALALWAYSSVASAAIVKHCFHVRNLTVNPLCERRVITAVNGRFPGPTINVHEGDTLVVRVVNKSPYNVTIHWHGIFQLRSGWADGADYITQCSILPGDRYTYVFDVTGQVGTLWWHSHILSLRATVYGALIIRPSKKHPYPFQKPYKEFPILLGEWWDANVIDVETEALAVGAAPNISDAFTINGQPGDLYNCSNGIHKVIVEQGETYLLRIINAALNTQFFFKIADHTMTVVAVDANYVNPMATDTIVIAPGQTVDALLIADQAPGAYYMAAHPYASAFNVTFDNTTTTGIVEYECASSSTMFLKPCLDTPMAGLGFPCRVAIQGHFPWITTVTNFLKHPRPTAPCGRSWTPVMPDLPAFNDTPTAFKFYSNLTSLVDGPYWAPPPLEVDEHMFVTEGLGLVPCGTNETCEGPLDQIFAASMNNESFVAPTILSMLEAFFYNVSGIYTTDFPKTPTVVFDYTDTSNALNTSLVYTSKSTKVTKLKFNSTVQIVLQNTAFLALENHPIHLHGFNFYVLAQGFGNYDNVTGPEMFNLVNPQIRNTIGVPVGGWAVIRFTADNPGVWFLHCHLDAHMPVGLGTAFVVEDGPTSSTSLPPPPPDLPHC